MTRPRKCCRVACMPGTNYFKPAGIPLRFLEEVCLNVEEMEAVRLSDIEDLEQAQGAQFMNISRTTFQRVLESARKKIAEALVSGKAIKIEGGHFEVAPAADKQARQINNKTEDNKLKIAVVTDDEVNVSQHFGRASLYMVFTVEGGKITAKEKRPKMGHSHFAAGDQHGGHGGHGAPHGFDAASQGRHASMAEAIADCQVLIAGGMGMGAFESMKSYNIEPVITDKINIDEAVKLYAEGKLPNLMNRLH